MSRSWPWSRSRRPSVTPGSEPAHHTANVERPHIATLVGLTPVAAAAGSPLAGTIFAKRNFKDEFPSQLKAFIEHFDRSHSPEWKDLVPGAAHPWAGKIVFPKSKDEPVKVYGAMVLVPVTATGAVVPMMTVPAVDPRTGQVMILHKEGVHDVWDMHSTETGLGLGPNLQRSEWILRAFRSTEDIKVVFLSSDHGHGKGRKRSSSEHLTEAAGSPSPASRSSESSSASIAHDHLSSQEELSEAELSRPPPTYDALTPAYTPPERNGHNVHASETASSFLTPSRPIRNAPGFVNKPPRGGEHREPEQLNMPQTDWRPDVPTYSPWGQPAPPDLPVPNVDKETLQKAALRIRAFLQYENAGITYRGVGYDDKQVHISDFSSIYMPQVDGGRGGWVLETHVKLKGVWTIAQPMPGPYGEMPRPVFTLPGATLDARKKHMMNCVTHYYRDARGRSPLLHTANDRWTFSSRTGQARNGRSVPVATTWTFQAISRTIQQKKRIPPVVVTFTLDKPHEVQPRHEGEHVEAFSLGHRGTGRQRVGLMRQREGRIL